MKNRKIICRKQKNRRAGRDAAREFRVRLFMVTLFFALLGSAVIARAVYLQIFLHTDLTERAVSQYHKSVYLSPSRGIIYDRRGRELAANVEAFSVYSEPLLVKDRKTATRKLSALLDLPSPRILKAFESGRGFAWLKRQITPREAKEVKKLNIPGIGILAESRRFYPHRELASQLIGFAGVDSQGLEGIEYTYDRYLKGNAGWLVVQRDALDRAVFVESYQTDPENRGNDLMLTIDLNIQYFAQEEIRKAVDSTGAKEGIILVMAPDTGEILAMAINSYFNPNDLGNLGKGRWRNICLSDIYEPGSTIKPIILAAALEEGKISKKKRYYCGDGHITICGKTIRDTHPSGVISVSEIISQSSNVGAIKIGMSLSREDFFRWITNFGFGRETGIGLHGESKGLLRPAAKWSGISQPSISIGQEVGVTPLQLIVAFSTIGNKGLLQRPRVIKGIYKSGRATKIFPPEVVRRVISPKTARIVKDILRKVVEDGTGKAAAIPGYSVAGKTGTAQKYDVGSGSYSDEKYISSFVGFTPADDPAIVVLVMLDEPAGSYYGGTVAAPVFAKVSEKILNYLAILPDELDDYIPEAVNPGRIADAG